MDGSFLRVRRLAGFDVVGALAFLAALWGLSLVIRGAVGRLCPGCAVSGLSERSIAAGLMLLMATSAVLWSRDLRRAAIAVLVPGAVAAVATLVLAGSFAILAIAAAPSAASAAAAGLRPRGRWDRSAVVWTFTVTAVLGAAGTGWLALAASLSVVVGARLGPDPDGFLEGRRPDRVIELPPGG